MVIYCTRCWKDNPAGSEVCPRCGSKLEADNRTYIAKLIQALSHPEPMTVERAAWILGELKASEAIIPIVHLLKISRDMGAQEKAVEALGKIGDSSAVDALASNSAHWPVRVRVQVAESLGKIGGPKAEKVLRTMLNDSSSQVHETTSKALKTLVR
ncbi:HEAT repeat domain-containing protein [Dehalogenimonas alkenigignens]|uniref:HEAT repeat protein n=1 Tax=Dehalogenimonas alkenigignens TaxID=1217799 RepID=A0A0W0GI98_9CHLR|nr:HEAT repeat domain-containing protein [Dehalogenimonas alkenigignens]KTB48295.1 HEAT repeat protein [Dehalogenimonas alkenigignens]